MQGQEEKLKSANVVEKERVKASAGVERYRLLLREAMADDMGVATPRLAALIDRERGFLVERVGVEEGRAIALAAELRPEILRRWGSEINALGSLIDLVDPELRKRINAEIQQEVQAELEKKAGHVV